MTEEKVVHPEVTVFGETKGKYLSMVLPEPTIPIVKPSTGVVAMLDVDYGKVHQYVEASLHNGEWKGTFTGRPGEYLVVNYEPCTFIFWPLPRIDLHIIFVNNAVYEAL